MTDRALTAAFKTETESPSPIGVVFAEFMFTTPVRVWTGLGDKVATMPGGSSQTWIGVGDLGGIESIIESADRRRNGVLFSLSGVDTSLLSDVLTDNYQGKDVTAWEAYIDDAGVLIADPALAFSGIMDTMGISDGDPSGIIKLQCESRDILLQRTSRSLYTNEEQQLKFPGDLGLEFMLELQDKQIIWGAPGNGNGGGGGAGFGGQEFSILGALPELQ